MKSEVKEREEIKTIDYPCLKILKVRNETNIVLFTSSSSGVSVYTNMPNVIVGEYSTSWSEVYYEPFNGTVTLSND